ncbi:TIR domain-containing protein [Pseudonocardia xinjiangensis]|uniref:WD40 domain-containing protein n=1 Tax=Pseudonocardia xinjiangensis TaxID=75289 RepID=UPI003D8BCFE2
MDTADAVDFYISYSPADDRWATWIGWTLTEAGFRVRLQAWDFMPGTNFTEFTDSGVRNASVVIAVLSRSYSGSRHGSEWQAALRHDPRKLVMIRVEDCPLDGLLAPITFLDLVGQRDDRAAANVMVRDLERMLDERSAAPAPPPFPGPTGPRDPDQRRRVPVTPPAFPPTLAPSNSVRESLSVLHVPGPRFGRGSTRDDEARTALELQYQIFGDVSRLVDAGVPTPDLVVVTGDVTEAARPSQVMQALEFLQGLRALLHLDPDRVIVVPGRRDVSHAACRAYFSDCEANERRPVEPYFAKLRQFATLLDGLHPGLDGPGFDDAQPWGLVPVPPLRVVVAALNSTMAISHRTDDDYGLLGQRQSAWFAEQLRPFEQAGWLRIGVVHHDPSPAGRSGSTDPLLLRDADTFDRLVGGRLNLLIHGPALGGTGTDTLGSGLVTVGTASADHAELVQLTAHGFRRFPVDDPAAGRSAPLVEREWRAAGAAFGPSYAADLDEVPEQEPVRATDPQGLLLERIGEVCVARDDRCRVRLVDVDPPHLLVTRREEGFTPQWRIGAHVGEITRDILTAFCTHTTEPGAELVYEGPNPPQTLRDEAARRGVRLRSFTEFQGLIDLSDFLARQTARLRADRRYPPSLYVPQRFRDLDQPGREVRADLATELVDLLAPTDHGRFVLVLGEFGHGKTFVMREVARRLAETSPAVIPILIELRTLDTANSVAALVAAHLTNEGETRIDINAFLYMLREGRIVLLFDGFDELVTRVSYDRAAEHLGTLVQAAQGRAKIVVASRTQHFRSHGQVVTALGEQVEALSQRRIIGVEDFTPAQIRVYLLNRYHGDERRADARLRLVTAVQSLADLGQNPRMLSFIADLPDERLQAAARSGNAIGASGLYREIIDSWLSFETDRAADRTAARSGLTVADRRRAATALALRLWETGAAHLGLADLAEVVDALTDLADGELSGPQVVHAVASGSLLVRTDDGLFGFIHRSVMEWLVADAIADELRAGERAPALLHRSPLSQLIVDFLCELADPRHCRAWVDTVLADARSGDVARVNAMKISSRLRIPATADLRGASLVGEDLSYRSLDGVDLTGADLTGARLVAADLRGARLNGARLVGARLDEARMAGADLRGADLTRARLTGTDLTGAQLTGSVWRRAALINATGVRDTEALRGAAVAPGHPVAAELAPAAVGVRHGFHSELGRLPQVLAYSPDGGMLAIGSEDGGVLVCDTVTGLPLRTLQGHRDRVFAVSYGGDVLVTGSADATVRVWDAATGACRHVLAGHDRWPWPVALDPTAEMLATGDAAGVLRLWDVSTGQLRHELPGGRGFVADLAWRGHLVAAVYRDGSVRLWDTTSGASLGELTGAGERVFRVAFSPAGDLLATGGRDGDVRTWDPATGRAVTVLSGHSRGVYAVAFHPTERLLACGDASGGVRIWDVDTGRPRHVLAGHTESVHGVAFDPAGGLLATGDSAGTVLLWDTATGQVRHTLTGHTGSIWPFAFRPDGTQLAVSDDEMTTRLWDPATGHRRHVISGHDRQVTSVHYDSAGTTLATSGNDGTVRLWAPATGRLLRRLKDPADQFVKLETAVFSPTAARLAIVSNDSRLNLFNLPEGRFERHIKVEPGPVWAIAFSPSGAILATANDDDTVRLWDRTLGRLVHTLGEHGGRVRSIAYNDDGTLLATGCDDGLVRLWDAASGTLLRTLAGHGDRVYAVDFAGSDLLASGSWDATARVWDVATGTTRHVLDQHGGRLWTVAFGPGGALLATAGDDLAIRVWQPQTGALLHTLTGHTGSVLSVAFHPAGGQLASGSADGTVRLWSSASGPLPARMTLLGLPEGWAAFTPDGRYKVEGEVASQFWHVVGMCRFEIGELDPHLAGVARVPVDESLGDDDLGRREDQARR